MPSSSRSPLHATALYLLLSGAWVLGGGYLLSSFFDGSSARASGDLVSGYVWVFVSAWLLYLALKRGRRSQVAQQANRLRASMTQAVFDSTLEGVLVTDVKGKILHVNRAFMDITGYGREEVLGQNPSKFKSGRHGLSFYQIVFSALEQKGCWSGEIWNRRKNGEIYPQWQTIRVIYSDDGNPLQYVAVFSDISAAKRTEQALFDLAHHDPLTELPNRLLFAGRLEQALPAAEAAKRSCALLLIDVDFFQSVNDSLGHSSGDRLLKLVGQRLKGSLGGGTTLARLGGDEFGIFYEKKRVGEAAACAQLVLDAFKAPFMLGDKSLFVSVSIGISVFPDDAGDAEQLLRNADSALLQAKQSGRGRYAFYTEELTALAQARLSLGTELRQAIERNELRAFYQPVHDLASGKRVGFEALVRWMHPERGLVSPAEFIPVAEHSGLIAEIDRYVMAQACRQMSEWRQQGHLLDFIAVNISSRLFGRAELERWVAEVLAETGLAPELLELEVTEGAVMNDPESALDQLHRLRQLGVRLAIDDFGTGYSSLLRLKRLPVQKLKIDQGFVAGLPEDGNDAAIVQAIVMLGRSLGMQVHAEGIEQPEQAAFLRDSQCDLGQGYLYGRPVPAQSLAW